MSVLYDTGIRPAVHKKLDSGGIAYFKRDAYRSHESEPRMHIMSTKPYVRDFNRYWVGLCGYEAYRPLAFGSVVNTTVSPPPVDTICKICLVRLKNRETEKDVTMSAEDINHRFAFHAATTVEKRDEHTSVRQSIGAVALKLDEELPDSREKSLALTKLEEAMFWANAAIARNQ